jgi:hypothetical protein
MNGLICISFNLELRARTPRHFYLQDYTAVGIEILPRKLYNLQAENVVCRKDAEAVAVGADFMNSQTSSLQRGECQPHTLTPAQRENRHYNHYEILPAYISRN